ncbi:hypothetical protein ACIQBJ_16175 [Kitasatospora sp. NPDC088391]|uniref:hypothetical protein n=1 Tax=Kitasatospora sp. NPDC088391 TaxID=3364074 RepID=UPI0038067984
MIGHWKHGRVRPYTDGLCHDFQAIDPTRTNGHCEFLIWDSNHIVYDTYSGVQSPWIYDGPGHTVRTQIIDRSTPAFSRGIHS